MPQIRARTTSLHKLNNLSKFNKLHKLNKLKIRFVSSAAKSVLLRVRKMKTKAKLRTEMLELMTAEKTTGEFWTTGT